MMNSKLTCKFLCLFGPLQMIVCCHLTQWVLGQQKQILVHLYPKGVHGKG